MDETLLVKGSLLWDGISDKVLSNRVILIKNGLIKAVGTESEITSYSPVRILDFPGCTLIPGLIDSHTHLSMDPNLDNYLDHMSDPVAVLTLRAIVMMRKDLQSGVTTCRCCGDKEFLDIACRQAVQNGLIEGPFLLVATRGIRASQGHGFVGYPFDGTDQIRKAIRENIVAGADFIKIYITGTLKENGQLPSYLSREEIRVAIEESHHAGLRIAAHCVGGPGMDWALEMGLDSLEHAYHIRDFQINKLFNTNTQLVMTPSPILTRSRVNHLPTSLISGHLKEREEIAGRMTATIKTGIPFAVGTDGMHGDLAQEIVYLVALGASPLIALRAATIHGAKVCGIENKTGSLEPGKYADIIAVDGNPLENIHTLKKVVAVLKHGQQVIIPDHLD